MVQYYFYQFMQRWKLLFDCSSTAACTNTTTIILCKDVTSSLTVLQLMLFDTVVQQQKEGQIRFCFIR